MQPPRQVEMPCPQTMQKYSYTSKKGFSQNACGSPWRPIRPYYFCIGILERLSLIARNNRAGERRLLIVYPMIWKVPFLIWLAFHHAIWNTCANSPIHGRTGNECNAPLHKFRGVATPPAGQMKRPGNTHLVCQQNNWEWLEPEYSRYSDKKPPARTSEKGSEQFWSGPATCRFRYGCTGV